MEIVDKISEKAIKWLTEYILSLVKESKRIIYGKNLLGKHAKQQKE